MSLESYSEELGVFLTVETLIKLHRRQAKTIQKFISTGCIPIQRLKEMTLGELTQFISKASEEPEDLVENDLPEGYTVIKEGVGWIVVGLDDAQFQKPCARTLVYHGDTYVYGNLMATRGDYSAVRRYIRVS